MRSIFARWAALALLACGVQGCVSTTPNWDSRFGNATRDNLAAQVINPAASANRNPAVGLDGSAARAAVDNYQRSFARPETGQPVPMVSER
jgi:type IV pilus biogenesis protein CpaD/CtpE